jgi:membrane-associated HD superfamily phosphohydrolase
LAAHSETFGVALGRLYGWNTLGAVLGVAGAELVLIASVGIAGSAWVAALLNMGAAFTGGLASAILVLGFVPLFEVWSDEVDLGQAAA